jgi:hypothetical protein
MILAVDGEGRGLTEKKVELKIKRVGIPGKNAILGQDFGDSRESKPIDVRVIANEEVSIGVNGQRGWRKKLDCVHRSLGRHCRQFGGELYNLIIALIGYIDRPVRGDRYRMGVEKIRADRLLRVDHD